MKRILTSMVLIVVLFPALALGGEVTMDDLVERDGLHYKKFTDVPFTGKTTGKWQGSFRNGKKHGPWVEFHDNGQLHWEKTFKDGGMDGPWVRYWENGQLRWKGTFKDGMEVGPWVMYYDNGQLMSEGTFKNGKNDGPWVFYNRDGTVNEDWTGTFKDGEKVD